MHEGGEWWNEEVKDTLKRKESMERCVRNKGVNVKECV